MNEPIWRISFAIAAAWLTFLSSIRPAVSQTEGQLCNDCIPFDFNYNGQSVTSIGQLNSSDPALVVQTFSGGVPNGGFTDTGAFEFSTSNPFIGGSNLGGMNNLPNVVLGPATTPNFDLYLFYSLSGTSSTSAGTTTIKFTPGAGSITLFADSQNASLSSSSSSVPRVGPSAISLAAFQLVAGTAVGTSSGGAVDVSSFAFTLEQVGGSENLFTTISGQDLFNGLLADAFEVGSMNLSEGQLSFDTCTEAQLSDAPGGAGDFECATPNTEGSIQLAVVSEPGSLLIFVSGIFAIGCMILSRGKRAA